MNRVEYVNALRELANFVESKNFPDKWRGWYDDVNFPIPELIFYSANRNQFGNFVSILGASSKSGDEISTDVTKNLPAGAIIRLWGKKEAVCERIVVGTKTVEATPEKIIPAIPAHEEEIVEWKCPKSFLALKVEEEVA